MPREADVKQEKRTMGEINSILGQISTCRILVWCDKANGQIGKLQQYEQNSPKIIGPNVNVTQAEKGEGQRYLKYDTGKQIAPMDTWRRTPLTELENAK